MALINIERIKFMSMLSSSAGLMPSLERHSSFLEKSLNAFLQSWLGFTPYQTLNSDGLKDDL